MHVAACRHAGANDLLGRVVPSPVRRWLFANALGYCFGMESSDVGNVAGDAALIDKFHDVLEQGAARVTQRYSPLSEQP